MMNDDELLDRGGKWFRAAKDTSKDWRTETITNYDFYAGHQLTDEEKADLEESLRPIITFNRVQPMVSAVQGQEINNRREVRFYPREEGDVQVNELLTGAVQWADDECDAEDEASEIFLDLVVCGMGWSDTKMSYDEDLDGKLHTAERIDPLEMWWDHTAKRRNLADAKWIGRGKWVDRKEAETKWPKLADVDIEGDDGTFAPDPSSERSEPHDAARAHFYENDQSDRWYNEEKDQVWVFQLQWWEHEPVYRFQDPQTQRMETATQEQFDRVAKVYPMVDAKSQDEGVAYVKQLRKTFYQAFIVGPSVLERGECPCPRGFTSRGS